MRIVAVLVGLRLLMGIKTMAVIEIDRDNLPVVYYRAELFACQETLELLRDLVGPGLTRTIRVTMQV